MPADPTRTLDYHGTQDQPLVGGTNVPAGSGTLDHSPGGGTGTMFQPPEEYQSSAPRPAGRFVLGEEIARGGMGEVYAARDTHLNRDVAVKVLQAHLAGTAAERRFLEEARITGQLQHPGVPPVYDLGTLPDGRPFLAMKLIKGRTLDDLLKADGPGGRWLSVFEGMCQAVGYAHSRGVIHRDLKPLNVMVGAFGEVQVMDWGLAKLLGDGTQPAGDPDATTDVITAIGSDRDGSDRTRAGSVMGTPAYMAPEQAIGAVDQLDRRTDVFGLGAVLCALLTGKPPYQGSDAESTRQLAARGKLDDAFERLGACGADPDLVALCKRCLNVELADRPASAGAVATEVAALRAAADDRARAAEVARGQAAVRESEGYKRRRTERVAAGLLAMILLAGVGVSAWLTHRTTQAEKDARDYRDNANRVLGRSADDREFTRSNQMAASAALDLAAGMLREGRIGMNWGKRWTPDKAVAVDRVMAGIVDRYAAHPTVVADLHEWASGVGWSGWGGMSWLDAWEEPDPTWAVHVERHLAEAVRLREAALGLSHDDTIRAVHDLARACHLGGDLTAAERFYQRAAAAIESRAFPNHLARYVEDYIKLLERLGRWLDAERWRRQLLARDGHVDDEEWVGLGRNLLIQRRWADAEAALRQGLGHLQKRQRDTRYVGSPKDVREMQSESRFETVILEVLIAEALQGQRRYAAAEEILLKWHGELLAREQRLKQPTITFDKELLFAREQRGEQPTFPLILGRFQSTDVLDRLAALYAAWGKPEETAKWRAERSKFPPERAPHPRLVR